MTSRSKNRTTRPAKKAKPEPPPEMTLFDSLNNWDLFPTTMEPFEMPFHPGEYATIGYCGVCLKRIQAIQPGGIAPRHQEDQTPLCSTRDRSSGEDNSP